VDLYDGLYREAVRRGVRIEHGKRLVEIDERAGEKVVARFADDTFAEGDLVIGADGVHSATRSLIDASAPTPRYAGLGNTGGFARTDAIAVQPGKYEMIWGKRCFFGYTVSPDGEIWWFANPPSRREISGDELRALTTEKVRQRLIDLLRVDDSPAAHIVGATTHELRLTNQYDLPEVPIWHNRSVVIIGDGAHAVSPSSGQGCSRLTSGCAATAWNESSPGDRR
jgi:2-polyprenyl-6-methoxyphenol hydroxylase-like FAD-dependent oxidoreductase